MNCDRCGREMELVRVFEVFFICGDCYKRMMLELKGEDYEKE